LASKRRKLVARFFNRIKQCRCVATRYDKLAANYLAFVKLVYPSAVAPL
jgi:transposase